MEGDNLIVILKTNVEALDRLSKEGFFEKKVDIILVI